MLDELLPLLGMLTAVAAILVLAYLFTRYVAGRGGLSGFAPAAGGKLRFLDQLSLGKDQKLAVVQAGERFLLLGVTPSGISLLTELTPEEAALWRQEDGHARPAPPSFKEALMDQLKKRK